jgi:hypothetical protein
MTKLLIALATTVALVGPAVANAEWGCGEVKVTVTKLTSDHLAEVSFTGFFRDLLIKDGFKFRFTKDGGTKLNGKACKQVKD